jgi:hypothetical protein
LDSVSGFDGTGYTETDYSALSTSLSPPSLDDLAGQFGDGVTADDLLERVALKIDPGVEQQWIAHRSSFDDDNAAMGALL